MIALTLSWPTWGARRLSWQLARDRIEISPSAVYRLLRRVGLGTRRERLRVLEAHSAESAGLLTERTRERLRRAKRRSSPHVEAEQPAPTGLSSAQTLPPEIERRDTGPKMRLVPHVQRSCCTDSGKPPENYEEHLTLVSSLSRLARLLGDGARRFRRGVDTQDPVRERARS